MAYNDNQKEFPLPEGSSDKRESARHLPKYFRTEKNQKFLQSTLDQLLQPGTAEKINSFVGRKTAKSFISNDSYLEEVSSDRENYQLEPVSIIKDSNNNVTYYQEYRDYINQIANFNGVNNNHSRNTKQEFYTLDPHINWDMFSNFRNYYWLPNGPQSVTIPGEQKEITSTYTVELQSALGDYSYVFSPDGLTNNPTLKLYRGVKYRFEIVTPGVPLTFRTARTLDDEFLLNEGISEQAVENGVIELELGTDAPDELFYVASNDINIGGLIKVANQSDASFIDVENEIISKKTYTTRDGWSLTNGLKIKFEGETIPAKYAESEWYVEGVGDKIKLISSLDVEVSFPVGIDLDVPFDDIDGSGFDGLPFSQAIGYPRDKDYITINRASPDGNFWSRYNRWFHKDVIDLSSQINGITIDLDQTQRASRPVIEFEAGLKLYNFGTKSKDVIDLIDDFTSDVFSTIEGSLGYNVDGVQLSEGMRVLFLNDPDPLVKGRVFEVKFINFKGAGTEGQISLIETADSAPNAGENVLVIRGDENGGKIWYYDGSEWNVAQEKTSVNQPPIFDVYDADDESFSNTEKYVASSFRGTKLFGYKENSLTTDTELGFGLSYRSINNVGDIVFDFNYNIDTFNYQENDQIKTVPIKNGFLRKYYDNNTFTILGIYTKAHRMSEQKVILQYINDRSRTTYPINCYNQSAYLNDLKVAVYVNNKRQAENINFVLEDNSDKFKHIRFLNNIDTDASIVIKCSSATPKNNNGYYEIASNLEKNPLNDDITTLTLGEISDHVTSIVDTLIDEFGEEFTEDNFRDFANTSKYGKKFLKHSSPLNLSMYSLLDNDSNLIKSIRYSKKEYAKFKREFLETSETLGFEGPTRQHVDEIIKEITKSKTSTMPFYFSDMIPFGTALTTRIVVEDADSKFFALNSQFTLDTLSNKAVTVYLNGTQLLHEKDYVFNSEGFIEVTATKNFQDVLEINEYDTTNGSFIPPTPTKLGLYPLYEPEIFVDNSYTPAVTLIRGHDGSITRSFGDYRDNLVLELEKRIFNNIKIKYESTVFNIHNYLPGLGRNTGFSRQDIYKPMISDFLQWMTLVNQDYTVNNYYDRQNSFTFNYSNLVDKNGDSLPGWWKGIYRYYFDTITPHLTPWEMLGFTVKPTWWEEQYGPAPYTKNNYLLWEDLEKGIIREPGKGFVINELYARPGLTTFIPVDKNGKLLGPSDCNIPKKFNTSNLDTGFVFGDSGPVEEAWRNSSEFPFALLTSMAINNAPLLLASGYDRSRQIRNQLGQIVYSETGNHIRLEDIICPSCVQENVSIPTSGVVNYIQGYMTSTLADNFYNYRSALKTIQNKLAFKIGGFTDKSKFKLILDSRTPLNEGNVFIPEENYEIFLSTSSPLKTINYSGVIVELSSQGFVIRGYDRESPAFTYYSAYQSSLDSTINIGGVSEPFVRWEANRTYAKDTIIEGSAGTYYRAKNTFTSGNEITLDNLAKLPKVPVTGGIDAIFKSKFDKSQELTLAYGSTLRTVQEVVDFLLGYEAWLVDQGFKFEYFDGTEQVISDWKASAKEFMFWITHNWGEGALISLSPAADQVYFETDYSVVDTVTNNFYGYSLLKADGNPLTQDSIKINRVEENIFKLEPTVQSEGIYAIKLPIVQKEHVVIIDNSSVFNDVVYQPETGYRQDRIKIFGYRTANWNGSLNIPGFVYSEININDWKQWQDYKIGDIVKYKEFYYTADKQVPGEEFFNFSNWKRINDVPSSSLIPNIDYKATQFTDFYDLDTDNFDVEQQQLAQHLIGYQKRQYLENIINDEVSAYKFYQGMIKEKGSKNSLDKLFDVLSETDADSLDFYEEWAIKQGQYGAADGFNEVEFKLDERKFRLNPQPIQLTNSDDLDGLVYGIKDFEVFKKPNNYSADLFPKLESYKQFTRSPGFVNLDDTKYILPNYNELLTLDIQVLQKGEYVWVGSSLNDWNVYQYTNVETTLVSVDTLPQKVTETDLPYEIELTVSNSPDVEVGEIIGIYDVITEDLDTNFLTTVQTQNSFGGFFRVTKKNLNKIYVESSSQYPGLPKCIGIITRFKSVKVTDYKGANDLTQQGINKDSLVWVENNNENWKVLKNTQPYGLLQRIEGDTSNINDDFSRTIAVDGRNSIISIASPNADNDGKLSIYNRGGNSQDFQFSQFIEPDSAVADTGKQFGLGQAFSTDGRYLLVGAPSASNVKSRFKGEWQESSNYQNGDIIKYNGLLWEVVVDIQGAAASQLFGSFGSIIEILQKNDIFAAEVAFKNIVVGNYPFSEVETDHVLIRAPKDQYTATGTGDTVFFDWYLQTTANQDQLQLEDRQPFDGSIPEINETYLESGLVIQKKVDVVLYVDVVSTIPQIGDQVEAENVFGYVNYVFEDEGAATIYIERTSGQWSSIDNLFLESGEFVGQYVKQLPDEQIDTTEDLGGYWYFDLGTTITVGDVKTDEGRGLAVYNIIPAGKANPNAAGGNIYDLNNTVTTIGDNAINSYIRTLTYQGSPGPGGNLNIIPSDLFVVRAPKDLTDQLTPGDEVGLEVLRFPRYSDSSFVDITPTGLSYTDTNKKHTLYDLWEGYIDFDLDETEPPDQGGQPYEPRVGQFVRERTPNPGATAKVAFFQKFNNSRGRIYVTDVQGEWGIGNDGRYIEMIGDETDTFTSQKLGDIRATALGSTELNIGGLCVFQLDAEIEEVPEQNTIIGAEYLIYKDFEILGLPLLPNFPGSDNFDYKQVFSIKTNPDGYDSQLSNFGYFTVYEKQNVSSFNVVDTFIVPDEIDNLRIGSQIKIAKRNDLYKAFIGCAGNGTTNNPGRIYFVNNGTDDEGIFYNWELAKDKRYKGVFDSNIDYFVNDYVYHEGYFYEAQTNVAGDGSTFVTTEWSLVNSDQIRSIDYLGYVPNDTNILPEDFDYKGFFNKESTYIVDEIVQYSNGNFYKALRNIPLGYSGFVDNNGVIEVPSVDWELIDFTLGGDQSLKLDSANLIKFGENFDVSDNGEVLVVTAEYADATRKIVVYRNVNDNYQKTQELVSPLVDDTNIDFGKSLSISQDGKLIAVGAPGADDSTLGDNVGAVYVYEQIDGVFELSQTLTSANPTEGEGYGKSIDFDGRTLYVSAYNASSDDVTTFDNFSTTFDNLFTTFRNEIVSNGVVYVYDRIDNSLIFGQTVDYHTYLDRDTVAEIDRFGRNILARNNHIYVAVPEYTNTSGNAGLLLDYRRQDNIRMWNIHREYTPTVDLEKIKSVFLYNSKENKIIQYLDYIDPLQGKIAGPADQEIRYKTPVDPAVYSVGTNNLVVDNTISWGPEQKGRVWWDLTNAKFFDVYQGNLIYKANNFNTLYPGASIDVYEWVESKYTPVEWDNLSGTSRGNAENITGSTKYGAEVYSTRRVYDSIAGSFTNYYYYWVKNKTTVPEVLGRSISVDNVAKLIEDPKGEKYKFISFADSSSFALHNCGSLLNDNDVVLNIQYWTTGNKYSNIHNQYQIITEGLASSIPNNTIIEKMIDSLIGYDSKSRPVPDATLSVTERYGILNKPRQSMFINRSEALKQVIERVNSIFKENLIVDEKDISSLFDNDPAPSLSSGRYDSIVDNQVDLEFVSTVRAQAAELSPVVENGKIVRVDIINPGRSYRNVPTYEITGQGSNAKIKISLNSLGQIDSVTVINQGYNYNENTTISVRPFAVLVNSDETANGQWAIYHLINSNWIRVASQAYDVTAYWNYVDWYADGYNQFTQIDHLIDFTYNLQGLDANFGDIVKVLNSGGEGWLLLEKIDEQDTIDYTVNFNTIGRQNGTIELKDNLYSFDNSLIGFDNQTFDTQFFDKQPIAEIRLILEALRNDILVADLATEFNNLFFICLRHVFAEQGYVDWAFKTSFVKAQHNVGELQQRVTFKNDNLESYENYINEVKPYKSKIREYISNYSKIENTPSIISDFDSPPRFDSDTGSITSTDVKVVNGVLFNTGRTSQIDQSWLENLTYEVIEINISDPGEGYVSSPVIEIEGSAEARASLGPNGVISSVVVTNPGTGYISKPTIIVNGALREGGREAKLDAVIGNSPVRSMHTVVKFDRVSGQFFITQLNELEKFVATGSKTVFDLSWPMDMRTNTIEVTVDGELVLGSNYSYDNFNNRKDGYDKFYGRIEFIDPPANESVVEVNYKKSINLLDAQDRINLFYNPTDGQIGKDISQLMDGVDYGGVEVKSFEFGAPPGWDTGDWYTDNWDIFDESYDDESFETDGSTLVFDLAKPLQKGVTYNVYINGTRVDDENWDGTSSVETNPYAFMAPIVGDGVTDTLVFDNEIRFRQVVEELDVGNGDNNPPGNIITIRRSTSDGSQEVSGSSYDTALTGGDLAYTTATGISAEDINIDGDGFVTPTTSKGPEETVPGQLMDTLDITVYERPNSGTGIIEVDNFKGDGNSVEFNLTQTPISLESVIVKKNYVIVNTLEYRVDIPNSKVVFYTAPNVGDNISIVSSSLGGTNLIDYGEAFTDESTYVYDTSVNYAANNTAYVTVNGIEIPFELVDNGGKTAIKFSEAPAANRLIQYGIFDSTIETFSKVSVDEIIADGSSTGYELSRAPFEQQPTSYYTIVTVNNERVLNAGYSESFTVEDGVLEYKMKVWQIPVGTVEGSEIKVFLNDRELTFLQEWTYEGAGSFNANISPDAQPGSTIILNRGVADAGDELKVFILSTGEYRFGYFDAANDFVDTSGKQSPAVLTPVIEDGVITSVTVINGGRGYNVTSGIAANSETGTGATFEIVVDELGSIQSVTVLTGGSDYDNTTTINVELVPVPAIIYFDETFEAGDVIRVYQFSNHNGLGIEREKYDVVERTQMTIGTQGYYDSRLLKNSFVDLRKQAVSVNYVWINVNGKWLTPTADYILLENKKRIQFVTKLNDYDTIDIIHFAAPAVSNRFGWRQFKDMLNRTTYLRLSQEDELELVAPLRWYDRTITVGEGFESLPQPTADSKYPGVIFIEGERIEYFRRDGNVLKQLRRGTLGTGVKDEYAAGTLFYNQGIDSVIPYKDEEERYTVTSGKYVDMTTLYPDTDSEIVVDSITYDFNNNTVFPVRVAGVFEQIATVTGSGFRPGVKVIMQDADGNERELEKVSSTDTEIKFHTETMPVGAYDLVIYNPREESPAIRAAESLVLTKFLPYVQILIPYEPEAFTDVVQNPTEVGEWYKAPFDEGGIPSEYWQALNIEVFSNGRRLRKNPITVYDVNTGQFSPDGDIQLEAEFAVNKNEGAYVRLTTPPEPETTLTIVRKLGEDWREIETSSPLTFKPLGNSNTEVATFLRGKTINLPR
jgi:hypothetical protein